MSESTTPTPEPMTPERLDELVDTDPLQLRDAAAALLTQRDNARADAKRVRVIAGNLQKLIEELRADWKRVDQERLGLKDERDRLADEKAKLSATIAAFPDANNAANIAHARMQRDRLAEQVKALSEKWQPAPDSAPEDRWDRGWDAAGREIAKQLRALIIKPTDEQDGDA